MITAAVIPAKNEQGTIGKVLTDLKDWSPDIAILVANGCTDATIEEAMIMGPPETHIIEFQEPLGIDVPRAVGAKYAYELGAEITVFIDGDMSGHLAPTVKQLVTGIAGGSDLALVNCYPYITLRLPITEKMLYFRKLLNQELGLLNTLGVASPSHGPHGISRKLISKIGFRPLAIPPLELAMARAWGYTIQVHAAIPHIFLNSRVKPIAHSQLVTETIIGDCIEGIKFFRGLEQDRKWQEMEYDGYNSQRRWDLLEAALSNLSNINTF